MDGRPPLVVLLLVASALAGCSGRAVDEPAETGAPPPPTTVDAYGDDPSVDAGTRDEVCRGGEAANRTGRARLAAFIAEEWPDAVAVLGFECREVNYPVTPGCDGEVEPPASECWSTHASGRAIDVVVSTPGTSTPEGLVLGDEVATAFLQSSEGVAHHLARVTGVQEIIWNGRCWYPEHADVLEASRMEPCDITGHDDHVHLTLSNAGADGETSWHTAG